MKRSFRWSIRVSSYIVLLALWGLISPPADAQFIDCESLYALRVALDGGLTDCDAATFPAAVPDCGGLTANGCSRLRYDQPYLANGNPAGWPMPVNPAGRPYVGKFLSKCIDGTDSCAGTSEEVRCMDGTRPLLYIHKAVDSNGDPILSNKWMFHTTGGGSGFRPERIWNIYRNGSADNNDGEMSTRSTFNPPVTHERFNGLYSGDRLDNPFREYNRVKLDKCTFDRVAGDTEAFAALDDPDFNPVTTFKADVRIFWHGMNFWVATLNFLTQLEGRDLNGDLLLDWESDGDPDLPSIADAEVILFTPWSGGAHGFASQADRMSDVVTTTGVDLDKDGTVDLPGLNASTAQVRIVVDGHMAPNHEVITADTLGHRLDGGTEDIYGDHFYCGTVFHPECQGGLLSLVLPPDGDPFTNDGYGPEAYSASNPKSWAVDSWENMGVHLDESCVEYYDVAPGDDDIAPCYDSVHNYTNHVETPFLIRHSLRDTAHVGSHPGAAHTHFADPIGAPKWTWGASGHKRWTRFQFSDVYDLFETQADQVMYTTVRDPGCILTGATSPSCWERAVFAPDQAGPGSHNGTEDNEQALDVRLVQCVDLNQNLTLDGVEFAHRTLNTAEAVLGWIEGSETQIDAIEQRSGLIDGGLVTGGVAGVFLGYTWFDQCSAAADFSNNGCVDVAALTLAGDCP